MDLAKRALFRGDDPEEIFRRIADFRSSEKSDPLYYARSNRHSKAQQHLCDGKVQLPTQPRTALTDQSSAFNSICLAEHP